MKPAHVSNLLRQNASLRELAECIRDCFDCTNPGTVEGDWRPYPHDDVTECWRCFADSVLALSDRGKRKKFRRAA